MDYRPYLSLTDEEIRNADPGEMNLKLAVDLPGAKGIDIPALVHQLNKWANAVRHFTDKVRPQFQRDPLRFNKSIGQFRISCMLTVIQRDFGVRYQQELAEGEWDARDSRTQFIHGPLKGYGGTCANLPILYLAIGWRLKYPLHLVRCREHLFLRWEGDGDRFNFEGTTKGLIVHDDVHYRHHPKPAEPDRLRSGEYLTNLTPAQNIGLMFLQRNLVLRDHLRSDEGIICTQLAAQYDSLYGLEVPWQRDFHDLLLQLCQHYRVHFTKLLLVMCEQSDWQCIAFDFIKSSKTMKDHENRLMILNNLQRLVGLQKADQDKLEPITN